jgi:DoxX-like family
MNVAYLVVTVLFALLVAFSGLAKIRREARQGQVLHEKLGIPLKYIPMLAACEFAGALGLMAGIRLPSLGIAAGIGLVLYFIGAIVSHLRIGDSKGVGPAAFMLVLAAAALTLRILT